MTLIFVYNANSGALNTLFDVGHKLFSPSTYACKLCALTFDTFTENTIWKSFREASDIDMAFFHIDEFEKAYPNTKFNYPVVLENERTILSEFLSSETLASIKTIEQLIDEIMKHSTPSNIS